MAYMYDNLKLEKGMYGESGKSFAQVLEDYQQDWRQVVASAVRNSVAVPAFAASLSYYDGLRDPEGPLNLLQAQRDCFGAHTFRRTDREGIFHHPWNG